MNRARYRVRQLASGRWLAEVTSDWGETWHRYASRAYVRRGDAVRVINTERVRYGEGAWWVEGEQTLSQDEQATLQAWKDANAALIEAETAQAITGLSDEQRTHAEFIRWLIEQGKLDEELHPRDFGLSQPALLDA